MSRHTSDATAMQTGFARNLAALRCGRDAPPAVRASAVADAQQRLTALHSGWRRAFGITPEGGRLFSSPGRTEIGGNHCDHQQGRVLCAAIDLDILAWVRAEDTPWIRLVSAGMDAIDPVDIRDTRIRASERNRPAALMRGVVDWFVRHQYHVGGFTAFTTSQIPRGSGLSSSAAFEMLVAQILNHLYNQGRITPGDCAQAAHYAENTYFGKPCGLMDQMACALGGMRTLDFAQPGPLASLGLPTSHGLPKSRGLPATSLLAADTMQDQLVMGVTDTGGSHADLTAAYAAIPRDMRQIATELGVPVLAQTDVATFFRHLPQLASAFSHRALLRAMHFFAETERVGQLAAAWNAGDTATFLTHIRASGHASWMWLQNILVPGQGRQQPLALGLAAAEAFLADKGAVRVHGGGFAGTFQAFVRPRLWPAYRTQMDRLFGAGTTYPLRVRARGTCEVKSR